MDTHLPLSFRRLEYLGMWSGSSDDQSGLIGILQVSLIIVSVPNCVRAKLDDRNALGTPDLSFVFDEEVMDSKLVMT
jgi:hypothetical protein